MDNWAQLEAYSNELIAAVNALVRHRANASGDCPTGMPQPLISADAPNQAHHARRSIKANIAKLQVLIDEPVDFLQQLVAQVRGTTSSPPTRN
jgi:hypothetical protein